MEEKYWELREAVERAYDKCYAHNTVENHIAYISAKQIFENFCVEILEKLMEENSDVFGTSEMTCQIARMCVIHTAPFMEIFIAR